MSINEVEAQSFDSLVTLLSEKKKKSCCSRCIKCTSCMCSLLKLLVFLVVLAVVVLCGFYFYSSFNSFSEAVVNVKQRVKGAVDYPVSGLSSCFKNFDLMGCMRGFMPVPAYIAETYFKPSFPHVTTGPSTPTTPTTTTIGLDCIITQNGVSVPCPTRSNNPYPSVVSELPRANRTRRV